MTNSIDIQQREEFAKKAEELFSSGTISEKMEQIKALISDDTIKLFRTALPWIIEYPEKQKISGFSETFAAGLKDINGQLFGMEKILSKETIVYISVDEKRLTADKKLNNP